MANELRIQNGLYLDSFNNNASYANLLTFDTTSGQVGYLSTSSIISTNSVTSSYPIAVTGSTLYSTAPPASIAWNAINTIGNIFLGVTAGAGATNTLNAIFLGQQAGSQASNAGGSVFIGAYAGDQSTNASSSIFIGPSAGSGFKSGSYSVCIGESAGYTPNSSVITSQSIFIGPRAGYGNYNHVGYNNIVIGTNINVPANRSNSLNIGGVIFATGIYSTYPTSVGDLPFTGSQDPTVGKIGIGITNPSTTLHVSGTVTITGTSASFVAPAPPNVQVTTGSAATNGWRGLGTNGKITPTKSGRVFAMVSGYYQGAIAVTSTIKLFTSSSATAPTAGATNASIPTGSATQIGAGIQVKSFTTDGTSVPFSLQGLVTLTTGTTYWFDTFTEQSGVLSASLTVFEI